MCTIYYWRFPGMEIRLSVWYLKKKVDITSHEKNTYSITINGLKWPFIKITQWVQFDFLTQCYRIKKISKSILNHFLFISVVDDCLLMFCSWKTPQVCLLWTKLQAAQLFGGAQGAMSQLPSVHGPAEQHLHRSVPRVCVPFHPNIHDLFYLI